MPQIAPIGLQYNPRTLWFDPCGLEIHKGDSVIVETARGIEFGHATDDLMEVSEKDIKALKSELKPVVRLATPGDEVQAVNMVQKSKEALPIFKEMALAADENMHPVSVEYLFEGDKAIFYFEAEERIDFRELVRKLASHFRVRVDMRQVGVRDEARMIGGYGQCGQELCCKRMGGEFCTVSIRMAKEQDLSLNPQKISGVCGRLMCCLRYEFDAYKEFKQRAPKVNAQIDTPEGKAKVKSLDVPREEVTLRLEEGKTFTVPLASMKKTKDSDRPNMIDEETFEKYSAPKLFNDGSASVIFDTTKLIGQDKLADPSTRSTKSSRKQKSKSTSSEASKSADKKRKPRKRRTHVGGKDQEQAASSNKEQGSKKRTSRAKNSPSKAQGSPRPGQKSSGLRGSAQSSKKKTTKPASNKQKTQNQPTGEGGSPQRKPRRRSHKANTGKQD